MTSAQGLSLSVRAVDLLQGQRNFGHLHPECHKILGGTLLFGGGTYKLDHVKYRIRVSMLTPAYLAHETGSLDVSECLLPDLLACTPLRLHAGDIVEVNSLKCAVEYGLVVVVCTLNCADLDYSPA